VGCGESDTTETNAGASAGHASPTWLLASMPDGAVSVSEARARAGEGETVTIRGIIGGRKDALSESSGVFVIIDESIENPCLSKDDNCATPWDYCCTPRDVIASSNATVQLVDGTGSMVKRDLRELGIEELDRVVVVGEVAARPSAEVLTVRAKEIYAE
jgi:hypothetical protein